jgi:hypothetical protein
MNVNRVILNPIIVLLFAIAFLYFFFGLFQFINSAGEAEGREEGKKKVIWGLVGMFIMFSAYGLIHLVLSTFGLSEPAFIQ